MDQIRKDNNDTLYLQINEVMPSDLANEEQRYVPRRQCYELTTNTTSKAEKSENGDLVFRNKLCNRTRTHWYIASQIKSYVCFFSQFRLLLRSHDVCRQVFMFCLCPFQRRLLHHAIANSGSVRLSVCLSHSSSTPKRFKISKGILHHTIERCFQFLEAKFRRREFRGSP